MFGGAKPTFGASATGTGFGGFNTSTTMPFGQSAFGKPATTAFGAAPTFGTQQPAPSMFGTAQTPPTGLFAGASTSSAFGATTTTQPTFGGFSQPQQNTSIFGAAPAATTNSLFGQPSTSAFGSAVKPGGLGGFGQPTTQSASLFGQPAASTSATGFGTFGQAAPATTNVFGSTTQSAFGQPTATAGTNIGTSIAKYQPTIGTDTLMKGGQPNSVNTKQHCITAMKEYETRSLEELRMEDYLANRKGPQAGTSGMGGFFGGGTQAPGTTGGVFGAAAQQTAGFFGQPATGTTENKGLFGASAFGQPATSAFGATAQPQNSFLAKPFGTPSTTGFGGTATDPSANLFGAKPGFGQTAAPSLFGQTPAVSSAPAFGQTTTGFGGFGSTAGAQPNTLFGTPATDPNKPAFGLGAASTANTSFGGFGTTATSTASGGLFGAKPATGFGTTPAFGATSTTTTGFTNFSLGNTSGGLFNTTMNKPATTGFGGFGTQTSTAPLNFNTGTAGGSLFGNTAAKPGGLFGSTLGTGAATTGGGLFGTGATLGGGFGSSALGGTNTTLGGLGGATPQQAVPIHQQILAKVTSPYGDNPIFKDLKRSDETDATRATNPIVQKAILDSNSEQFNVTPKNNRLVKAKPVCNGIGKKSLFDSIEEFDPSLQYFSLKPNAKRLILHPKPNNPVMGSSGGSVVSSPPAAADGESSYKSPQRQVGSPSVPVARTEANVEVAATPGPSFAGAAAPAGGGVSAALPRDSDTSRRESWLHHNLEKVRQQNFNTSMESPSTLNTTLSELVPRKPLETYRSTAAAERVSISTVPESPFEDSANVLCRGETVFSDANDSLFLGRSAAAEERSVVEEEPADYEEHPTGIVLRRIGYYTIPSMDDLKSYLAEDGSCVVPNFTVGREGYGNVYFAKEMDVAGLNLDEIVHFRNKEIIIFPDDNNKPEIGNGLNREAQVTLDQVWPHDKTKHEPIKDPERLLEMDWEGKLRRACAKNDTRFIEYRPETGSWVFRVKHFSKYGLSDSDEDDDMPTDPKKAKMAAEAAGKAALATKPGDSLNPAHKMTLAALKNAQKISEDAARALDPKTLAATMNGLYPMDESAEFMFMDKTQYFNSGSQEYSMFAPAATSPTSVLAKETGAQAPKLQLMKSSLFIGPPDVGEKVFPPYEKQSSKKTAPLELSTHNLYPSVQWDLALSSHDPSGASSPMDVGFNFTPLPPLSPSGHSAASHFRDDRSDDSTPVPASDSTGVGMSGSLPRFTIKPSHARYNGMHLPITLHESIASIKGRVWMNDQGLNNIRFLRTCFGPQNTLVVPSTRHNLGRDVENKITAGPHGVFKQCSSKSFCSSVLQQIKICGKQHYEHFTKSIVDHLKIQLQYSVRESVEGSNCSWYRPENGTDLISRHLDEAIKLLNIGPLEEYAVSVWSLCLALWGVSEELEGHESNSHYVIMCRRNLFSEWLENTLTDNDLLNKDVSKQTYVDQLLELIMCHKVFEACELALTYDDANLALLLSQLSSGPMVRKLTEDQLADWHSNKTDNFIHLERLKMLMLVAGITLMNSSHGPINILEGIEWIKVLALHLWYLCSPTASVTDALLAYEKSFKLKTFYSAPPTPNYLDALYMDDKSTIFDLRYHLLQLYSKRSHPLEKLLNPATHTADPMDYRLSWLVLETLEALGYHHCSELSESQIHVGFASQLENYGLWEWAVFVVLHIKQRNPRELAVQDLLYRYVTVNEEAELSEKEIFIVEKLGVPEQWIDYAKAVKAGSIGDRDLEARYLLKAKQWHLAHEVIYQNIAPDAVINDDLDYLHNFLSKFERPEHNKTIPVSNWANQGQIFLDFIDVLEKFKGLKILQMEADIETHWENLKPRLADLCSRINLLPCPSSKHRLCQSEIAQNLACLVRGVLVVCPGLNACLTIKIALDRLPLPQEFAQQELRTLLRTLVTDFNDQEQQRAREGNMQLARVTS